MNRKKIILFISIVSIISLLSLKYGFSFFYTKGTNVASSNQIEITLYTPVLNDNLESYVQTVDLSSTITNDKALSPGAEGYFDLKLDFTNIKNDGYYIIRIDRTNMPTNLKVYSDSERQNEYVSNVITHHPEDNSVDTHRLYWKWIYLDDNASNTNDNTHMNTEINIPITINYSEKAGTLS